MCNHEQLLDYLYDELPAAGRAAAEEHLRECGRCRTELAELGGTRLALSSWSPPESELGYRVVRNLDAAPARTRYRFHPAWALAAAAVLILALAAAIARLEVRYGSEGLLVRTGWGQAGEESDRAAPAPSTVATVAASDQWQADLRLLDARLQQLERSGTRAVSAATAPNEAAAAGGARMGDAELLRVVRRIIAESEARQQRELALRVTQVIRDFDSTRAGDLARVEQGLRQIQGLTDAELIRHRDTLHHLLRVTQR